MIVARLTGGLGNQLFQYAAGRALALKRGVRLGLDIRPVRVDGARKYELDAYNINASPIEGWGALPPSKRRPWRRRLWQATHRAQRLFEEQTFAFDPRVLSLPDGTHLHGLFQCEAYFADAAATLRSELTLREALNDRATTLLQRIRSAPAVSLHVRRGDYVTDQRINAEFGAPGIEYYRAALATIAERTGLSPTVFIFSDEPEWVRQNMPLPYAVEVVDNDASRPPAHDLALMSACRHHVIANSSFSWWGAWLNPSPTKVVVAPKIWFANSPHDTSTVVPHAWIRL